MKKLFKITKWVGGAMAVLLAVLTITVAMRAKRKWDAPYPQISVRDDAAAVERGRYLAYGAGHCVDCHGAPELVNALRDGPDAYKDIPLSGGRDIVIPIGTFRPANITPDVETGIGALRDEELARALRHGVGRHGTALVPFMPFANMSDEDIGALIAFLRRQPAVRNPVQQWSLNPLGYAVAAFLLKPEGPRGAVPAHVQPGPTVEYGRYLANDVANCRGCHTDRDLRTGKFTGAPFAGGLRMPSEAIAGEFLTTPNLTPDGETGRISQWTEDLFIARFRMGRGAEGTPMPWKSFATMTDDDLRALYRYLRSVPAVRNHVGDTVSAAPVATRD